MLFRMAKGGFRKRVLWLFCRWLLVGGLSALAVGVGFAVYTSVYLLRSVATKGTIVRLDPVADNESGTINYAPVFSFTSEDGQTHTIRSGVASDPPGFEEGEVVRVFYIRSNPGGAKIGSSLQLWIFAIICSGLGMFFGVPGYLLLRNEQKRKRQVLASASAGPMPVR
jgi:hypothetical protein